MHVRRRANRRSCAARLARAAFLAIVLGLGLGSVAPPSHAADEPVTLNFVNADIDAVIKAIAEITGRNFVVDPKVKGTINIISARPVPRSLVYPTLLSALPRSKARAGSSRSSRRPTRSSRAAPSPPGRSARAVTASSPR
jgi:hypothetical protein